MPTVGLVSNANTNGFLSNDFPHGPPKLYFTAESDDFDELTIQKWRNEGFKVEYLSMGDGGREYGERLEKLGRTGLGVGETMGIVAYGEAAAYCLERYHSPTSNSYSKLCTLIAYYPTAIPDTRAHYPSGVRVLVHLAGSEVGVTRTQQVLGIQGKRRTIQKRIDPGLGAGGTLNLSYPTYTYEAEPGFAEHDLDEYERISAEVAWTRSLDTVRRAFRKDVDLESVWEQNVQSKFFTPSTPGIINTLVTHKTPHVTHTPTLTGGTGAAELRRFYDDFFVKTNPPSLRIRLISRTIGADRIVDELHMAFKHSQDMPWILPGISPTNKKVEIIIISIVCMRGGKLFSEHVYWDQASVLVQVGLLDPKAIPAGMKQEGAKRLPVIGREAARRIVNGGGNVGNELIPGWEIDSGDDSGDESGDDDEREESEEVVEEGNEADGEEESADDTKEEITDGEDAEEDEKPASVDKRKNESKNEPKNEAKEESADEEGTEEVEEKASARKDKNKASEEGTDEEMAGAVKKQAEVADVEDEEEDEEKEEEEEEEEQKSKKAGKK